VNGGRPLGRQILAITAAETGASFEELAERTGATFTDIRAAVWALYGLKRADICHGYVTAPPRTAKRGQAS
jgi:hypothetical protein